jgi:hypothetical protein
MRSWKTLGFVLALAVIAPVPPPIQAGVEGHLARQLRSTVQPLLSPSPGETALTRSLVEVLAIAARSAEEGNLSGAVRAKLGEAHAAWRKTPEDLPDPGVRAALGEAYAGLNGGRAFEFPAGVHSIEQAREACRKQVDGAVGALEAGRFAEATRGMVELLMTVTTPMEAH